MPEPDAIRKVVSRAWSKEGMGEPKGEFGWEIVSVAEYPEALEHAASARPDGA